MIGEAVIAEKLKAVLLCSGGLDSIISLHFLVSKGIEVIALLIITPFCNLTEDKVYQSMMYNTSRLGVHTKVVELKEEYLEILRNPKYGFGKAANPCVDCHILMLKQAKKVLEEENADFIVTGDVVNQRPFSQKKIRLKTIDRDADVEGLVLRPLSGKILPQTVPEEKGWIKREDLFNINGRGRTSQITIAKAYEIEKYPLPAGGCVLTDPEFARRFKDLKKFSPDFNLEDIALLRYGRHFRLDPQSKLIISRRQQENDLILRTVSEDTILCRVVEHKGPLGVYIGDLSISAIERAASYIAMYSKSPRNILTEVRFWNIEESFDKTVKTKPLNLEIIHEHLV